MKRIQRIIILCQLSFILLTGTTALASEVQMLIFYQQGCPWCARMDKTLKEPDIQRLLKEYTRITRINVRGMETIPGFKRNGTDLTREYKISGTPTIIFVDNKEKVLLRVPGALSKQDFMDVVCQYIPGTRKEKECIGNGDAL
ncbi:MAG TPA: hypothetical protein ENI88_14345 [Desulfobulbus sp.]|nr:hypothetical protein [Desulfobulbus sp.]